MFTPDDEGKRVVTPVGDSVGIVERVSGGAAYVRPRPGLVDCVGSWLNGCFDATDCYRLKEESVAEVHDDTIVLESVPTTQPSPSV
jgi:hypothetical protein